ncbi:helix-turn-helix domain-containing protein [Paenibacillus yanchengensis]|uniref:Helix-turn-helix domain-containing protein n=1 Tax=Paenibacillus yanchengensis TaxID=2035833 RepID=A0ABW4YPP8_9BACL
MRQRNVVFLTLWLSYIIILIIPVALSVVLYSNVKSMMSENANRSNYAMLEQVRTTVDQQMEEIDLLISQIATNPKLQLFWSINEANDYITNHEAVTALKNIRSGSKLVNSFFIHDIRKDIILTPGMKTDTKMFLEKISRYGNFDLSKQRETLLSGYHFKSFVPAEPVYTEHAESVFLNQIAVKVSLPLGESNNVRSMLVLYIDEQTILNMLEQVEKANNANIFIINDDGQVLISTASEKKLPDFIQMDSFQSGYRTLSLQSENVLLSQTEGMNGWKYISVMPSDIVLQPIHQISKLALILLVIAIVAGAIVAYWLAYRNYSPVRDLVRVLTKETNESNDNNLKTNSNQRYINEYDFIKTAIEHNMQDRKRMQHLLADHAPVVRSHFLTRILQNRSSAAMMQEGSLDFMGIHLNNGNHCVVIIDCDDSSQFRREDSEQEWALVRFILLNLSSELMRDNGYVVETGKNQVALLFNVADDRVIAKQMRDELINNLQQIATVRFKLNITFASSSIHAGAEQIARCYSEAMSALDYRIIHGTGAIIYFDQIKNIEPSYYEYSLESEIHFINILKSGDYEQAEQLLEELYTFNMSHDLVTSETGKFMMIDILSTVMKVVNALKIDSKQLLPGIDLIRYVMDRASVQEMLQAIKQVCYSICKNVTAAKTDPAIKLNEQLKQHLQDHALDHHLSLTSIASAFNMAPAYISTFFKKHNNINITEYIAYIRMEEAKQLLSTTSFTIMHIAQTVGYANDIGFIRVFKKHEGITPGKYREIAKQTNLIANENQNVSF